MDENLAVFVNRRKKLTTKEELEKCSKEVSKPDRKMDGFRNKSNLIVDWFLFNILGADK